ncbi:MAG TPA: HD domain-containing protein, partial [Myxococcota bacterium]|nr:HD domain-containing protein [Myxococcota bacterium]
MSPAALEALVACLDLKALPRAGWVRRGVEAPESVAAHSWGVAWLVLALAPPEIDRGRALTYAVLHDLAEVRTGDITPHDGVPPAIKAAAEARAIDDLLVSLPLHLREAWRA